ncbi:MAG: helix-turn-helix domain-containing protein [Patescibacteria group bacterium]
MLKQVLAYPGLSRKEAEVYLASLEVAKPTPLSVSKETYLPRPTIYRIMEDLVEKGLMGKVKEGKHIIYVPEDPRSLLEKLRLQTSAVQNVMGELRELATIYKNRPTVRFFEGRESIKRIFEDIFQVESEEVLAFTSIKELYEVFPEYYSFFVKRRVKRGIRGRIIAPLDSEGEKLKERKNEELRDIRFIPEELAKKIGLIGGHMLIYKDRVALVSFDSDQTSVIIENKALANVQRSLFEIAWESIR